MTLIKWYDKQLDVLSEAIVDWNNDIREMSVNALVQRLHNGIGGSNMIV